MTNMVALCTDLADEQAALDALVANLDASQWATPTPAEAWTVQDQIGHLAYLDGRARRAVMDPDRFRRDEGNRSQEEVEQDHLALSRRLSHDQLVARWREERTALVRALRELAPGTRLPWYGPPMGAATFVTARLMETWSHGQDVADALELTLPVTDRLRHVAHLGVRTRRFSYAIRGRTPPMADVRVELTAPNGDIWRWGDAHAVDRVAGPARDFCLVVTQRRHPADTELVIDGSLAREWMDIAQAFAGRPGPGRSPGQFSRRRDLAAANSSSQK